MVSAHDATDFSEQSDASAWRVAFNVSSSHTSAHCSLMTAFMCTFAAYRASAAAVMLFCDSRLAIPRLGSGASSWLA